MATAACARPSGRQSPEFAYLAASAYVTDRATRTVRTPIEGTPSDLGLLYQAVTFESDLDHIPLKGWYLPSRGERAIIFVHGIGQNRWNTWERIPQKAQLFVEHGYDVLVFDLRGHGQSGGDRLGFGWLERNDVRGAVAYVESRGIAPWADRPTGPLVWRGYRVVDRS